MQHSHIALITGGGGAIAAALALRLERDGYHIVLVDRNEASMQRTAELMQSPPTCVTCDMSDAHELSALCERIADEWPHIDLLVNCVGFIEPGAVIDISPADLARHVSINQLAPMVVIQTVARLMVERGEGGDILSVISMGGIIAMRGSAAYAASKFGLRGFQTSLRSELLPYAVRVMGVFPSAVDTPMLRYEATHPAGSPLNFFGKVHTVEAVADACMRALEKGNLETYLPYSDGVLTRFIGMFPWLIERIGPWFEEQGERGRQRFLRRLR
jgi:short-subunit dehydrogenase